MSLVDIWDWLEKECEAWEQFHFISFVMRTTAAQMLASIFPAHIAYSSVLANQHSALCLQMVNVSRHDISA